MTTVTVMASRWKLGWDLELVGGGATQVRALGRAVQQVHDYLDSIEPEVNHDDWTIDIIPQIPRLHEIRAAQAASAEAARATAAAAKRMRRVVKDLRRQGISGSDAAAILGVTRGRVSQLSRAA